MQDPAFVLKHYWGFERFRPVQLDIIKSVLSGRDTLALLPTGGGKSICFQVPTLCMEGICLVVSPLIALMKDQVENLKSRGIKAAAIYSGMTLEEIDLVLDNCMYGAYKFLYLSPERLLSEKLLNRISRMQVCLISVDEAHCISQWGYDFRPPYLEISKVRELHPKVPVLALTASATPDVGTDIMARLAFKNSAVFQKSFTRKNLSYHIYAPEDKNLKMISLLKQTKGSAIVYTRNRKRTQLLAQVLIEEGIASTYYHAGLGSALRTQRQDEWKSNKIRVMVSTNAFGMGIDKPDVQFVIHMDLPDDLESYYQEAGRAGRNEQPAFAVLLYNQTDLHNLKGKSDLQFPTLEEIRKTYKALCNYLQVPLGGGMQVSYDFDMASFINAFDLNPLKTVSIIRTLEAEGFISVTEGVYLPSKIHFCVSPTELYRFQVANPIYDKLLKAILRSAEGAFEDFVKISESDLADRTSIMYQEVVRMLEFMAKEGLLKYSPRKDAPQMVFCIPREAPEYLNINIKSYKERKLRFEKRVDAMMGYVTNNSRCRSSLLVSYFGEIVESNCGRCDICMRGNTPSHTNMESIKTKIIDILRNGPRDPQALMDFFPTVQNEILTDAMSQLVDMSILKYHTDGTVGLC